MKRECISLKKGSIWIWTNTIEKQLEGEKGSGLLAAEKAQISSLMGKELLGQMLLEQYGIDLSREKNPLGKERQGKPFLVHHPEIYFNISHSENLVSCGVGNIPLGLDIQFHKSGNIQKTARRILSPEEWTEYEKTGCVPEMFFHFWTKKESYLKYTGEGIRRELSALRYEDVQFFSLDLEQGYTGMVCIQKDKYRNLP